MRRLSLPPAALFSENIREFVGAENVVSAMVHMDEKTSHMHFFHVPVTQDGRPNVNKIWGCPS